ncbi:hypothetical protein [Bifidobacterium sp. ESL0764]|uniref:hypothetical protein n=1 Tax=Bifidobacterium sp. ESL0764 TaxID=2983228 RepID=UPI0023F85F0A|nr:hypothetical protein [Bifidobacterium sp. ESL0764]WEV65612.1 hypothetical protein OZX71_07660 [Bifidobacterium sp. ESL0764]
MAPRTTAPNWSSIPSTPDAIASECGRAGRGGLQAPSPGSKDGEPWPQPPPCLWTGAVTCVMAHPVHRHGGGEEPKTRACGTNPM